MVDRDISYLVTKNRPSVYVRGLVPCLVWSRVLGSVIFTIYGKMGHIIPYHIAIFCLTDFREVFDGHGLGYYDLLYSRGVIGGGNYI